MHRKKYDIDYADDVKMWELVMYDSKAEQWGCMGIYAEDEDVANTLADMLEFNDKDK